MKILKGQSTPKYFLCIISSVEHKRTYFKEYWTVLVPTEFQLKRFGMKCGEVMMEFWFKKSPVKQTEV